MHGHARRGERCASASSPTTPAVAPRQRRTGGPQGVSAAATPGAGEADDEERAGWQLGTQGAIQAGAADGPTRVPSACRSRPRPDPRAVSPRSREARRACPRPAAHAPSGARPPQTCALADARLDRAAGFGASACSARRSPLRRRSPLVHRGRLQRPRRLWRRGRGRHRVPHGRRQRLHPPTALCLRHHRPGLGSPGRGVGPAALELEALGLEPAADLGGSRARCRRPAVGLQDAVRARVPSRMKRWLSVRAWWSPATGRAPRRRSSSTRPAGCAATISRTRRGPWCLLLEGVGTARRPPPRRACIGTELREVPGRKSVHISVTDCW